jgi:hypothetical protein
LTIAAITGVGACASEGLTLIADLFCKGCKKTVGAAQQLTHSEHLDRLYQFLPGRPTLSYRIERIVSQGLGIIVSVLGTLCVLALRHNWVVQQHQNLGNYNPKVIPRSAATAERQPASAPARSQHSVNPALAALAHAIRKPPAASTSPDAKPAAASPSRPPNRPLPPVPPDAVSISSPPPLPPAPPPLSSAAREQPLPEIGAPRSALLDQIRARGEIAPAASGTGTNEETAAASSPAAEPSGVPFKPMSPAASKGKLNTMGRALAKRMAAVRGSDTGILFERTDYGYRFGGEWILKDLFNDQGLNFPLGEEDDLTDTLEYYLFNYNGKVALKVGKKIDFNKDNETKAFQLEVEEVEGNTVKIVKIRIVLSKESES